MGTGTDIYPRQWGEGCLEALHVPKHRRQSRALAQEVRTAEALTPVQLADQKDGS